MELDMDSKIFEVSELNNKIKNLLDGDMELSAVYVRGELSNYKTYPSGHHYFTMKDKEGALRCVMFKSSAANLKFRPENGMKVIAFGRVTVFARDGAYQLYCNNLTPDGVGDLHVAYEQLKEKLYKEGLFDAAHKKNLPKYPKRIALITSSAGAAVRDMIRVLSARYPLAKVILLPVSVQGAKAPPEIVGAIKYANRHKVADLIITGRGGGSIEDLWAFNDENVARTIFASEIPVISAVGHEPDFTIADFVADLRAATPSNAAELAVPDIKELAEGLRQSQVRCRQSIKVKMDSYARRLEAIADKRVLQDPVNYIEDKRQLLDYNQNRLANAAAVNFSEKRKDYIKLRAALDAMSPLKVLGRGYSIAKKEDGTIIKDPKTVRKGDKITVRLEKGELACEVLERSAKDAE